MNTRSEWMIAAVSKHLSEIWVDGLGIDRREAPVDPNTNVVDWLKSLGGIWEEIDLADFFFRWKRDFGFTASDAEFRLLFEGDPESAQKWIELGDYRPELTMRGLAEWIVARIDVPTYSPVNVAGRTCGPAGAFFGIQELAQRIDPARREVCARHTDHSPPEGGQAR